MLRQEELAFIKGISSLQLSPTLLKELRLTMSRKKQNPAVPAGSRSTKSGSGARASQQLAGKRKANELASSGDSMEAANRRPAPGARSAPLPAISSVTGKQAAVGSRQPGPSEGGATYAAVLAGPVAPFQPIGPLKPTAMNSETSEPGVSAEKTNRRMTSDMSGPLREKQDGKNCKRPSAQRLLTSRRAS
jgi:hypothetical protein